jgi:hypothetical protein
MCCPPAAAKVSVLGDQRGLAARAERTARKSRWQFFRAVHATLAFTERNFQTIHAGTALKYRVVAIRSISRRAVNAARIQHNLRPPDGMKDFSQLNFFRILG